MKILGPPRPGGIGKRFGFKTLPFIEFLPTDAVSPLHVESYENWIV